MELTEDARVLLELVCCISTIRHNKGLMPDRCLKVCSDDVVAGQCLDAGLIEGATAMLDNGVEISGVVLTEKGRSLLE